MRTRRIGHREERLSACANIITDKLSEVPKRIEPTQLFPGFSHFRLEIGCGKGGFVCGESSQHKNVAYFAVELITDVIIQAAEKATKENCGNVIFINTDAARLCDFFPQKYFETVYINFCDPWPKKRHAKRRLTNRRFLSMIKTLLTDGGHIALKTDNSPLFEYSLTEFSAAGFALQNVTRDLHENGNAGVDTMTEYEKAFAEKGVSICRCEAYPASQKSNDQ